MKRRASASFQVIRIACNPQALGSSHCICTSSQLSAYSEQDPTNYGPSSSEEGAQYYEDLPIYGKRDLYRVDKYNRFLEVPQAWVSNFDSVEERKLALIDLHPDVFRTFPRVDILHRNIQWQRMYRNVTFTKALTRAEMPGGGRKPWQQKGTGRARHGSIRSPIWKGGGISHGIRGPRTWFHMLPTNIRLMGLCSALTVKHAQDDLVVVDTFDTLPPPPDPLEMMVDETSPPSPLEAMAEERNWGYSILFVDTLDTAPRNLALSCSDVAEFNIMPLYGLNVYSMLKHDTLVLTYRALLELEKKILEGLHAASQERYRYVDYKRKILEEAREEEGEGNPENPPFV